MRRSSRDYGIVGDEDLFPVLDRALVHPRQEPNWKISLTLLSVQGLVGSVNNTKAVFKRALVIDM